MALNIANDTQINRQVRGIITPIIPLKGRYEQWKRIPEYPNYMISSWGHVYNVKRQKMMKDWFCPKGYKRVQLFHDGVGKKHYVHRLVAQAFISSIDGKDQINHKDGIKSNNRIDNLEWVSQGENMLHAYHTLKINKTGTMCNEYAREIRRMRAAGEKTVKEMAKQYGVTITTIYKIINFQTYKFA